MKTIKRLLALAIIILATISCEQDSMDIPINNIVGTWQLTEKRIDGIAYSDGSICEYMDYLVFRETDFTNIFYEDRGSDGICNEFESIYDYYKIEGNTIIISYNGEATAYKFKNLNNTTLIFISERKLELKEGTYISEEIYTKQ